jgi:hypothetical protein
MYKGLDTYRPQSETPYTHYLDLWYFILLHFHLLSSSDTSFLCSHLSGCFPSHDLLEILITNSQETVIL